MGASASQERLLKVRGNQKMYHLGAVMPDKALSGQDAGNALNINAGLSLENQDCYNLCRENKIDSGERK